MAKNGGANWQCPYCGAHQAVLDARFDSSKVRIRNDYGEWGETAADIITVVCANEACKKMTLTLALHHSIDGEYSYFELGEKIRSWSLLPESQARPLPDYIPAPIQQDYSEACRIRDLSPKASATISRRCLQGMIRNFCEIIKPRLIEEIDELRAQVNNGKAPAGVQPDTIDAIDHVRQIGNIGAHMEKDINVIVDVDPDEAQILIGLLELLFDEWYISRYVRAERLKAIGVVAAEKNAAKHHSDKV